MSNSPPADRADGVTTAIQNETAAVAAADGTTLIPATGKYLSLRVNEFGDRPGTSEKMTAFLRIGAADKQWESDPSKSSLLEKLVHAAGPPGGRIHPLGEPPHVHSDDARADEAGEGWDKAPPFVDDNRVRGEATQSTDQSDAYGGGTKLTVAQRAEESGRLHSLGGWRDHSDGNRITTTWGDKVEVVRGNYKMVILGRQDDPSQSSGWDTSGSHIQDFGKTMPGASVRVEYVQLSDSVADPAGNPNPVGNPDLMGGWHLYNTTENVLQTSTFGGRFYTFTWGPSLESTIGTAFPYSKARAAEWQKVHDACDADEVAAGTSPPTGAFANKSSSEMATARAERLKALAATFGMNAARDLDYNYNLKSNPTIVNRTWAQRVISDQRIISQPSFDSKPKDAEDGTEVATELSYSGDLDGFKGEEGSEWPDVLRTGTSNLSALPSAQTGGLIVEYARAERVESYVGTQKDPVGVARDATFANRIETVIKAGTIDETVIVTEEQLLSRWGVVRESWFGVFSEFFAIESNSLKGGLAIEVFGGLSIEVLIGLGLTLAAAGRLDVSAANLGLSIISRDFMIMKETNALEEKVAGLHVWTQALAGDVNTLLFKIN